jgi:thiol-disulfide isomerase/thioredoxin
VFKAKRRTVVTVAAVAIALLAGALVVTLTQGNGKAPDSGYVLYPAAHRPPAPDFTATSLTGTPIKFGSYRGKVVVVNFWGSWCDPCRREAPTLAVLSQQYHSHGVSFLGVDVSDTPVNALAFTRSVGITYPSVNDSGYTVTQDFSQVVPIAGTPTTFVVDRSGHVMGYIPGAVTYSALNTLLSDATVTK